MKVTVCRKEHFNAAHRLHNSEWSDQKNETVFGKCNNANFHGHNYDLVVKVTGEPDPQSGYVLDMKILSDIIQLNVLDRFDHKNLNLDTDEFKSLIPTNKSPVFPSNFLNPERSTFIVLGSFPALTSFRMKSPVLLSITQETERVVSFSFSGTM